MYFSLYKKMYNDNIYLLLLIEYIITTNNFIIHENVFLLYETMDKRNICCHYILSYIITTNISVIKEDV